ncbi:aldehyde dehydrogenase family protein [Streptacidiphilus jiangxiensis]|uniref:NADP-dependent aldehyde dehydrogenase n=1 Tax=Streptacidiphilus jiangxiensis TaxID=235985 RepID=A0A1H7L913_STRJI|nr:aldehyde dehydrogenase family protein [Streptacidiphilus jiangxiensis]SEK95428.1 NADP-dependent aldehyde dehydrogenase [Streptacidiphilus jiangxiensis]
MGAESVWSVDPRSGERRGDRPVAVVSGAGAVDATVRAAHAALPALADRARRSALLRAAAERLHAAGPELIAAADAETALGGARLTGELARTVFQLRYFAELVDAAAEAGGFLDIRRDGADPALTPPRPDLYRVKVPLGVVGVFAASNFPFAFSVPGGDTATALAAGCPVVVKAHPDHPETSELAAAALRAAAVEVGLPEGTIGLVHGFEAGPELVRHPLVAGVGFTGSPRGGRALFDLAAARPRPIPFHGELGSVNPVLVTAAALAEPTAAEELARGLVGSFTLGMGQFCTKPGLVLLPAGAAGDAFEKAVADATAQAPAGVLLDPRMREAFLDGFAARAGLADVQTLAPAGPAPTEGAPLAVRSGVLSVPAASALRGSHESLLEECFGPSTVLVRCADAAEADAVLSRLDGCLTATLQTPATDPDAPAHLAALARFAGRVLFGGWPTGVAVADAMHHGGPYPASTSTSTSVGGTAVERWLRPVTFQTVPDALLPR